MAATILLVDDDESTRGLLHHVLQANGYRVLEAADGVEALEAAERHSCRIDLLLTDMVMPGMDGLTLINRLRSRCSLEKILCISAYPEELLKAAASGLRLIEKPFQVEEIVAAVRQILPARRAGNRKQNLSH